MKSSNATLPMKPAATRAHLLKNGMRLVKKMILKLKQVPFVTQQIKFIEAHKVEILKKKKLRIN